MSTYADEVDLFLQEIQEENDYAIVEKFAAHVINTVLGTDGARATYITLETVHKNNVVLIERVTLLCAFGGEPGRLPNHLEKSIGPYHVEFEITEVLWNAAEHVDHEELAPGWPNNRKLDHAMEVEITVTKKQ